MKKSYFWVLLAFITLAILPQIADAQNRTQQESSTYVTAMQAMDVGYAFMHTGNGSRSGGTQSGAVRKQDMQLIYTGRATDTLIRTVTDCYYIFALQPMGFVIVAADERVEPILGYSYDNNFVVEAMPDHVRGWLDNYERQIEAVTNSDLQADSVIQAKWMRLKAGQSLNARNVLTVNPLLQTTWNQNSPYNLLCPSDANGPGGHVYAGCVATAMAQIINFWQYPTSGIGSHSYNANFSTQGYGDYGMQSADFWASVYSYGLMPVSLNSGSSTEQIYAVAQLIYHCGVAVDMMYGSSASGAYIANAENAFRNYFGYGGATKVQMSSYTSGSGDISAWITLLKGELDSLRPVYYSGHGSGGHAFVCDGYDDQNRFHFNWGWSGSYNGFYTLLNLTPGSHDYSSDNRAIIGIDASQPMIHSGSSSLTFLAEAETTSSSKSVSVLAAHLNGNISATVIGNFRISTDNGNFHTSDTLGSNGGMLYIRYQPIDTSGTEEGCVVLSSGNVNDTIFLIGVIYDNTPHCIPPTNLSIASQDLHNISLRWDTPVIDPDPHTLTWSSDIIHTNYGYTSESYSKTMLHRFDNADLAPYHNQMLTRIRFYARSAATTYKAVVYKGGSFDGSYNPGTLVLSQDIDINTLTANTWNTITLNTPVIVDATQEMWFGIYVEAPAGTYCLSVTTQSMSHKGCIIGDHSSGSVSWREYFEEYSFSIQGIVENVQEVINYSVTRNDTVVGTTTSSVMSDYVTATDTYVYTVTANWNNGCVSSVQKLYTNVEQLTATPVFMDFFANYGHGILVKTLSLEGSGLMSNITATVTGNFQISTDGAIFATSAILPDTGGILYVKYNPISNDSEYETGLVTLASDSLSATVRLSGQCYASCNPPQDLVVSQLGSSAVLNWNPPVAQVTNEEEMTWYENYTSKNYGSSSSTTQRYIVHRFDTEDLAPYHGKQLTAVSFICNSEVTTYRIVVYQGGGIINSTYLTSGTQVVNQMVNVSSLTGNSWNTILLNSPVTIDANQELWYGIYLEAPAGVYPIKMGSPYVAKKGLITKSATASNDNWTEYGVPQTYCFSLKATIEDVPISLTHYQIDQNAITLDTTNNTAYSNNLLYNGNYDYDVWAVWSDGCKIPAKSSISVIGLCDDQGQSYTQTVCDSCIWNNETYTTSGTYYYNYVDSNDCAQVDTLYLTVNHSTCNVTDTIVCDSFIWDGTGETYTISGTYTHDYTNECGCASVDTLYLIVNESVISEFSIVLEDSCYIWNNQTYCETGDYVQNLQTQDGCDSVVTLHLTIETGINDHNQNASLNVYPNPTSDIINVQLTMNNGHLNNVEIQVFDIYGKLLDIVEMRCTTSIQQTASPDAFNVANAHGLSVRTIQIDLSRYANGVYFIKSVSDGNVLAVSKVVKNR